MAKRYRPVNRDQPYLLPPDMRDWLPEGHPVWLVITVVEEHLDTSALHAARKTGGAGAAGYDPDMLLMVLIWGYAHGVTSSRRMEQLCGTDVAFRVICGGSQPDHVTLARFRAAFPDVLTGLFTEVLALCARLGMGKLGVVALDGTKVAASASASANRTEEGLRKLAAGAVAAHGEQDAAEDALFGDGRGDEVPAEAWSPRSRDSRIAAALASLEAEREEAGRAEAAKAGQFRARREAGQRTGPAPLSAAVELAEEKLARAIAAQQARIDDWAAADAAARAATGRGLPLRTRPKSPASEHVRARQAAAQLDRARARVAAAQERAAAKEEARTGPGPVRNITDPDSRLMPVRGGGFRQGYNAQNMVSQDKLIIATELTDDTTDTPWLEPMLAAAEDAAAVIIANQPPAPAQDTPAQDTPAQDTPAQDTPGQDTPGQASPGQASPGQGGYHGPIGLALTDAGYLSEHNLTCPGPDRLIATGKHRDLEKAARDPASPPASPPGGPPGPIAAMADRLRTPDGITAYRQRGHIAETPHGHIKHNMGFRQLTMRGKPKARAEWDFVCTVHNLFKAITTGHLTTQALTALAS